jgi:hypothetical protein
MKRKTIIKTIKHSEIISMIRLTNNKLSNNFIIFLVPITIT